MPNKIEQLAAQREALLAQLQSIERLRRGSLSRQTYAKKAAGQERHQGPCFVLQGFHQGKKFSQRVPADQSQQVQQQVNNFKRFEDLADQCVTVTDQITQLAEGQTGSKKNSSRRRSKPGALREPRSS
ncbi:MAG: hypothetical protein KGR98_05300 [Verrucomicrobia bacterium]|nr:hypothetical protein [Verrucomicrobiota bacterium]